MNQPPKCKPYYFIKKQHSKSKYSSSSSYLIIMNEEYPTNNIVLHRFIGRRYIITKHIGQGSFGQALQARMPYHDNHLVVVKRLKYRAPGFSTTPTPPMFAPHNNNHTHHRSSLPRRSPSPAARNNTNTNDDEKPSDYELVTSPLRRNHHHFNCDEIERSSSTSSSFCTNEETQIKVNEIQALAALSHPNIVQFYEAWFDRSDGHLYFSMEYCRGRDLDYFLKKISRQHQQQQRNTSASSSSWSLPEAWLVSWLQQMLSALHYMSVHRILHRDIKLNNIFVITNNNDQNDSNNNNNNNNENSPPPTIKIGDFGLSRFLSESSENAKSTNGSPYYFSYEIASGIPHSFKTDVFSTGVVFYFLMTKTFPFNGDSLLAILHSIRNDVPSFHQHKEACALYSEGLRRVVLAMMTKNPSKRPSAGSLMGFVIKEFAFVTVENKEETINNNQDEEQGRRNNKYSKQRASAITTPIPHLNHNNIAAANKHKQAVSPSSTFIMNPFRMMLLKFQVPVPLTTTNNNGARSQQQQPQQHQTLSVNVRSAPSIRSDCIGKLTWGDTILVVEVVKEIQVLDEEEEEQDKKKNNSHHRLLSQTRTYRENNNTNTNNKYDDSDFDEFEEEEEEEEEDTESTHHHQNDSGGGLWYRISEPMVGFCIATLKGRQLFGRIVVDDHLTNFAPPPPTTSKHHQRQSKKTATTTTVSRSSKKTRNVVVRDDFSSSPPKNNPNHNNHVADSPIPRFPSVMNQQQKKNPDLRNILSQSPVADEVYES